MDVGADLLRVVASGSPGDGHGLEGDERGRGCDRTGRLGDNVSILDGNKLGRFTGGQGHAPSEGEGALAGLGWQRVSDVSAMTSTTTVVPSCSSCSLAVARRSASGSATSTSTSLVWSRLTVSMSLVRRWMWVMRTLTAKPPTTAHWGSAGKRASAATNDRMRPPRSPARMTASPGTNYPFGLPLLEGFEAAGSVLGDVKGDDDVVGYRPPLARCLGVVSSA